MLVLGAAGAVCPVAAQAARLLGAGRVIAAILDGERPPPGADRVVTRTPGEDWAAGFRDASGGGGADVIIDPVWGAPAVAALKAAAPGARLVQIGNLAGETVELAAPIILARRIDKSLDALAELTAMSASRRESARAPAPEAIESRRGLLVARLRRTKLVRSCEALICPLAAGVR